MQQETTTLHSCQVLVLVMDDIIDYKFDIILMKIISRLKKDMSVGKYCHLENDVDTYMLALRRGL